MYVVYGTLTAGQVDVVDKRFSVATEFFHLMWFPVFPVATRVIVDRKVAKRYGLSDQGPTAPPGEADDEPADSEASEQTDDEVQFPIPMSGKSVLLGYLRGWGFWVGLFTAFFGGMLALMSRDDPEAAQMYPGFLWTAGICLAGAMGSYYGPWNRARPARARDLCVAIGMDPKTLPNELRQAADAQR